MCEALREASASQLFTGSTTPGLLLTLGWKIFAANDAHLTATGRAGEDVLGRFLFDVFPDPPQEAAEPPADGVRRLTASLQAALARSRPDVLPYLRFDMTGPDGGFLARTWSVVNSPLFDGDGAVVGFLHQAEDISEFADEILWDDGGEGALEPPAEDVAAQHARLARAGAVYVARHRTATEHGATDYLRVSEALAALAGTQGANGRPDAQRGRREMWRRAAAEYREAGSYGWLTAVCRQADRIGERTTGAAVSASGAGGLPKVLAASDDWSQEIEQLQEMTGEGPGISARSTRLPVLVEDLRTEKRWPVFTLLAEQAGATAVWAVPVTIRDATVATMSVFGSRPAPWGKDDLVQAVLLADLAAAALPAGTCTGSVPRSCSPACSYSPGRSSSGAGATLSAASTRGTSSTDSRAASKRWSRTPGRRPPRSPRSLQPHDSFVTRRGPATRSGAWRFPACTSPSSSSREPTPRPFASGPDAMHARSCPARGTSSMSQGTGRRTRRPSRRSTRSGLATRSG